MSTHAATTTHRHRAETDSGAFWKVAVILLGFLVAALGLAAVLMWADAHDSRAKATPAATASNDNAMAAMPGMDVHAHTTAAGLESYADTAPPNAEALAAAHKPSRQRYPPPRQVRSRT